jgi:hypothetical protein
MRKYAGLWVIPVFALVLTPLTLIAGGHGQGRGAENSGSRAQVERGQHEFDRDRMRSRDRIHDPARDRDQVRQQDRIHVPGQANPNDNTIYGHELMSVEERNQYREQMQLIGQDTEERTRFIAEHQEKMQLRAEAQGANLGNGNQKEGSD